MTLFYRWACLFAALGIGLSSTFAQEESYPVHPDSVVKENVPQGKVEGPFDWTSKIYPGTTRKYWIYVPASYDAKKPAALFIVQDGIGRSNEWKLPTVMDNLIADGSMPVTIGVFIEPGVVIPTSASGGPNENAQPRFNRSFEYDSLGDRYAKFLVEEIIPEVKKKYAISDDPNLRAIGGASSGAICAFNVAWERPDQFRRVLSTIGTYVGLRGADIFPTLVRKHEPKPIRVFLQDGNHDLDIYAGDWFTANLDMLSALKYSGYEVNHVWGEGGHNGKQGAAIMPDALRWLWKDHGNPIKTPTPPQARINVLIPGEGWEQVSQGHKFTEGPAIGPDGSFFFVDPPNNKIFKIDAAGKQTEFCSDAPGASGCMLGPDGKLYACLSGRKEIVRYDMQGKEEVLVKEAPCNDLVVLPHGLYYTDPGAKKVFYVTFDGARKEVDTGLEFANGLICSADQAFLYVADSRSMFTYSYQIAADGTLQNKQTYGYLHANYGSGNAWADGMAVDTQGNLYVACDNGIQILDQLGRVNLILSKPQPGPLANCKLAGPDRSYLYVAAGDKIFRRKLKAIGTAPWEAAIKPPKPGL